jgi:hypothetical protein
MYGHPFTPVGEMEKWNYLLADLVLYIINILWRHVSECILVKYEVHFPVLYTLYPFLNIIELIQMASNVRTRPFPHQFQPIAPVSGL